MLNESELKEMLEKAEQIEIAIREDDVGDLKCGLEIECLFCDEYKLRPTQFEVDLETCCNMCPLWEANACHHSPYVLTDFRAVDDYWAQFKTKSQEPKQKEAALKAIRRLRDVIASLLVEEE